MNRADWEAMSAEQKRAWFEDMGGIGSAEPVARFFGLNDDQMTKIMGSQCTEPVNVAVDARVRNLSLIDSAPILREAWLLLREAAKAPGIKLTARKQLPRSLVTECRALFHDDLRTRTLKVPKESDIPELARLRAALEELDYLAMRKGHLVATSLARKAIDEGLRGHLYEDLFEEWLAWGVSPCDGVPPALVHCASNFLFFAMGKMPAGPLFESDLAQALVRALPEIEWRYGNLFDETPLDALARDLDQGFLRHFCVPFGFVTTKPSMAHVPFGGPYEKTPLFADFFAFKL